MRGLWIIFAVALCVGRAAAADDQAACASASIPPDTAIEACDRLLAADPKGAELVKVLQGRGFAHARKRDYERALLDYDRIVRTDPKNAPALVVRSALLSGKSELDAAMADADEAVKLASKNGATYAQRSSVWIAKGNFDRAFADADEAIRLDPKNFFAYNNRGHALREKGDLDRAIADFDEAIKLNPGAVRAGPGSAVQQPQPRLAQEGRPRPRPGGRRTGHQPRSDLPALLRQPGAVL